MLMKDDKIAIEVDEVHETKAGVYIPQPSDLLKVYEGKVVGVGPGRYYPDGLRRKPDVCEGDRVTFLPSAALEMEYTLNGERKKIWIVKEPEIISVLDPGESIELGDNSSPKQSTGMSRSNIVNGF